MENKKKTPIVDLDGTATARTAASAASTGRVSPIRDPPANIVRERMQQMGQSVSKHKAEAQQARASLKRTQAELAAAKELLLAQQMTLSMHPPSQQILMSAQPPQQLLMSALS